MAGGRGGEHFNLIRVEASGNTLALLHNPGFADDPVPPLTASCWVNLDAGTVGLQTCTDPESWDEIRYELYARQQIEEGLTDIEAGRVIHGSRNLQGQRKKPWE